jgi:hypothetical protein
MRCIQDTTSGLTVLTWPGVAPDDTLEGVQALLSLRLHIAAGSHRGCCGAAIELVAADPADPTLPAAARRAIHDLAPGRAVADRSLPELADGWIAVPGLDIRIDSVADLGGPAIAITFDDAVALLHADPGREATAFTTAIVRGMPGERPPGWSIRHSSETTVPLGCAGGHQGRCAA